MNTQVYRALVIPYAKFISKALLPAVEQLLEIGIPVIFIDELTKGFYEGMGNIDSIKDKCLTVSLDGLTDVLRRENVPEITNTKARSALYLPCMG